MHPRVSIDNVCMMRQGPAEFIANCRDLEAQRVVLSSPHLRAEGGFEAALRALDGTGIEVEAINGAFAVFPNLPDDCGQAAATLLRSIEIGSALRAKSIYFLTGGRGSLDWDGAAARFAELVSACTTTARERGMQLMI